MAWCWVFPSPFVPGDFYFFSSIGWDFDVFHDYSLYFVHWMISLVWEYFIHITTSRSFHNLLPHAVLEGFIMQTPLVVVTSGAFCFSLTEYQFCLATYRALFGPRSTFSCVSPCLYMFFSPGRPGVINLEPLLLEPFFYLWLAMSLYSKQSVSKRYGQERNRLPKAKTNRHNNVSCQVVDDNVGHIYPQPGSQALLKFCPIALNFLDYCEKLVATTLGALVNGKVC